MQTERISITEYCDHYRVQQEFIESLEECGIIELATEGPQKFIDQDQLAELERYRILHFELQINIEGIDAIRHLLQRQQSLVREVEILRSTLRLYERE